jgi:hypothetical protein
MSTEIVILYDFLSIEREKGKSVMNKKIPANPTDSRVCLHSNEQ